MTKGETERHLAEALRKALNEKVKEYQDSPWELISKLMWLKLLLELEEQKGTLNPSLHGERMSEEPFESA